MRCVGCETEPLTSTQYCESCGIRVWQGTQGFETPPVTGVDHWASHSNPASDARCESCGGPGSNGDLCGGCQRAFFGSWLDSQARAAHVSDTAPVVAEAAPIQERPSPDVTAVAPASDPPDTATWQAAVPSPVLPETTMRSLDDTAAAAGAVAITVDEARATMVRRQEARARAAFASQATGAMTAATHTAKAAEPTVVNKRQDAAVPSQQRYQTIALVATAVVVAAIGASAYWLQFHQEPVVPREDTQAPPAKSVLAARRRTSASGLPAAALTGRKSAAAPPEVPVSPRPKPAASAPAPARAVRSPSAPTRQVVSVSVPNPTTEAPAPVVEPSVPDVVAPALPVAPPAPVGRFFETADVNESPRVATRVEPQLPDELRVRPLNEIVIVRALVSQGGHPSRISLLRRSKTGPRLDEAVIAAVNQWTFSPAKKRGEAVSCWFNFGVPVGRAD